MRLDTKTAFVTGGGSGLGRATAKRFAEEGATVAAADIDSAAAEETVAAIEDDGGTAVAHELDVTDAEAVHAAIDATAEEHGLDVVVNNAGISHTRTVAEEIGED